MADIMGALSDQAADLGWRIEMMQSNEEGVRVTAIQKARGDAAAILFNLAAYAYTSVAPGDALAIFDGPKAEVHMSKNDRRGAFRQVSLRAEVSDGSIVGFGADSFRLGLDAAHRLLLRRDGAGAIRQILGGDSR